MKTKQVRIKILNNPKNIFRSRIKDSNQIGKNQIEIAILTNKKKRRKDEIKMKALTNKRNQIKKE
jgi:hypothetical protein